MKDASFTPDQVLDFWFPDTGHENNPETHGAFWDERMQGGMDAAIIERFGPLTEAAARGELDHWAETSRGRLALLIALDQFPRSYWRDTPGAYAQDIKAARLALEGIANGHAGELRFYEKCFFLIALSHCEGPEHLARLESLDAFVDTITDELPECLGPMKDGLKNQHERVKDVLKAFGRHPHRNAILGRMSTPEEEAYIAAGDFPHVRSVEEVVSGDQ
ncbi:MAG: DUF924 family protein [Paracoccaceae bacterium]|nr:DUF924 family protein [Paracoccaceae bacterium]